MSTPGMMYPTQKAMLAGNPRDSAIAQLNGSNQRQLAANASMAGGKMKRKHRGGAAAGTFFHLSGMNGRMISTNFSGLATFLTRSVRDMVFSFMFFYTDIY